MDGSKSTRIWRDLYEVNICNIRTKKKEQKAKTWVEFGGWVGRSRAQLWWIRSRTGNTCVRAAQRPETGSSAQDLSTLPMGV